MPVSSGGGGVTPLNVVIRISTNGVGTATTGMRNVTAASKKMGSSLQAGVITTRTLGDAMRMTSSLMKYTVAGAFMKMGQSAIQAYRNFELSFSRIKGLVGLGSDAVREMQSEVLKLATETTRGPEELADALYYVTSAGIKDANTAMSVLEVSARAAAAGLGETNTVADAVTSTMNAYGIENMSAARATDVLVATVREGKAEADTFAPALGKVLPVAAAFGASFEDVSAAIAALSRSGMTAGTSAIYVRQTLSQLLKPSKQAQEALYAVGTSAEEIRKNVRDKGLFEALQILSTQLKGVDEGAADFAKVFGNVRALTAVLSLVGPAAAENKVIFDRLRNSTGDLDDAFTAYSDTVDAQFNRAFAAQRVALVELGKSIKPIVSDLLGLATVASNVFKAIATFDGGAFVRTIAVLAISVTAMAAALKTGSALVRLFSNLAIVLTGGTLKWDALNKKIVATNISQQANNATTNATTVAQTAAGAASGFFATQLQRLGIAITFVQRAMGFLSVILAVASAAYMVFSMRSKKTKKEQDDLATSLEKVNDVLDETVKYGKSTIKLGVEFDVEDTQVNTAAERLEQQITEQSPDFFSNILSIYNTQGENAGNAFVVGLLNSQFGGVTGDARAALLQLFQTKFGLQPNEVAEAVIPTVTGSAVNDAVINNATIIAATQNEAIAEAMSGQTGITSFAEAIRDNVTFSGDLGADMRKGVAAFGAGFTDDINENAGNITSLVVAMRELDKQGALTSDTVDITLSNAFKDVNEQYKLFGIENRNLKGALLDTRNNLALQNQVMKATGASEEKAKLLIVQMRKELEKVPNDVNKNVNAFRIYSDTLGPVADRIEGTGDAASDASTEFDTLVASVRAIEEQYDGAQDALKRYEKAQRAILGTNLDIEQSTVDYKAQMQDLAEATAESGGSFDDNTEKGRKAREELVKSAQAVFDLANAYQMAGRSEEAGFIFARGMEGLAASIQKAGGAAAGISAVDILESIGYTEETWKNGILASEEVTGEAAVQLGQNLTNGIAAGIAQGQPNLDAALIAALNNVIITGKKVIDSKSPSKRTAMEIGKPMAQGVSVGFTKEAKSGRFRGALSKSLDDAITQLYKTGNRNSISKYLSSFLEKKKNVETPAQDFVRATIDRMKDIIGSLGGYIKAQLNFRNAQSDLAKLINMQRSYDSQRKRSAREVQYAETRFGGDGGAQVTGYEQAQIDELQLEFERVSRDYAMGRATYIDLVDAEIALFEARAAASEVNDDVIGAQNDFIDKTVQQENRTLELSGAIVSVQEAYLDQQEAAAELYMNHKELNQVYTALAEATGIASGKIVIGTKDLSTLGTEVSTLGGYSSTVGGYMSTLGNNIGVVGQQFNSNFFGDGGIFSAITKTGADVKTLTTNIGADFTNLSRGLLNTDSQMYRDLNALGPAIFNAIRTGAQESLDKSPLNLQISIGASIKGGKGSIDISSLLDLGGFNSDDNGKKPTGRGLSGLRARAVGGPVDEMTPYVVGERGPELFVPKVSGTIVTNSALERYSRTRASSPSSAAAQSANNIVVTVNNPVPQAAEDSITRRMKVLANSGLFG